MSEIIFKIFPKSVVSTKFWKGSVQKIFRSTRVRNLSFTYLKLAHRHQPWILADFFEANFFYAENGSTKNFGMTKNGENTEIS